MADDSPTISFRVPVSVARQLETAGQHDKLSRNEHARRLVLNALAAPSSNELLLEIREVKQELADLGLKVASKHDAPPQLRSDESGQAPANFEDVQRSISRLAEHVAIVVERLRCEPQVTTHTDGLTSTTAHLKKLEKQITELHNSLATGIAALLVQAAKVAPDEARRWVTTNLFPSEGSR